MFSIVSKRCCRDASTCLPFLWKTQQQPLLLSKLDTSSRYVHSNTQIKRLFKQNATRARIEERMGIDRTPLTLDPPKYPQVYSSFTLLPNGWSAPPGPDFTLPNYPFSITRTKDKPNDSIGFLPVYSKFR